MHTYKLNLLSHHEKFQFSKLDNNYAPQGDPKKTQVTFVIVFWDTLEGRILAPSSRPSHLPVLT